MNPATRIPLLVAPLLVGGAAAAAWLAWPYLSLRPATPILAPLPPAATTASPPATPPSIRSAVPGGAGSGATVPESSPVAARPAVPGTRRLEPPRFDIVRVGARGTAVVAGRAMPGVEVILYQGGQEIGRARADQRGEWVILPDARMGVGAHELSLRARLPDGQEIGGTDTAVVVVPDTPALAATRAAGERAAAAAAEPAPPASPPGSSRQEAAAAPGPAAAEAPVPGPTVLLLPTGSGAAPRPLQGGNGRAATLGIDIVDYDDQGNMRFAGSAPAGAQLRVYADDRHVGDVRTDESGRWSLAPETAPAPGRHRLRVDQLPADGAAPRAGQAGSAVAARVEVAFQREALPAGTVRDGRVVVQPGQNLWRLAREAYGRGTRYTVIYGANRGQIRDPRLIYPGQVLDLPGSGAEGAAASPEASSRSR
ncbi:LysM peptidoglycan-binding domain-containing protein [Roseomonas sp. OT10]|uniref:LysM peptidoglycan-binding domain-containing protein n=1 Tax=Roseomonas cutis TaxID=2897332 RepID=UPI001E55FBDC|nr:LysM peptidoglycan-binding domain-containing protein [Roseomonas sp. OT10]UFN50025.1 LysM peptidoglycan-binding domain-containing protein [Roseomonas sp. OT10]